jgi:hypothetical protein
MPRKSRISAVFDGMGADGADVSWPASPWASACATGRRGAEPGSAVAILCIGFAFSILLFLFFLAAPFWRLGGSKECHVACA